MRTFARRLALTAALTSMFTASLAQGRDAAPEGARVDPAPASQASGMTWVDVPTRTLSADGVDFAYRELGKRHGARRLSS